MPTLQEIINYSKANPNTEYAKNAAKLIQSGEFDVQAQKEGIDLSFAGRKNFAQQANEDLSNLGLTKNEQGIYKAPGFSKGLVETGKGIVKGLAETGQWLASKFPNPPGVQPDTSRYPNTVATNQAQQGGKIAEKVGEFLIPLGYEAASGKLVPAVKSMLQSGKNFVKGVGNMIKGKPEADILATPAEQVYKLPAAERKLWFDNQQAQITNQSEAITQQVKLNLQKQAEQSAKVADDLAKQLKTASRNKVIELRPKIVQAMGEQSQTYRSLISEEMAGKENIPIKIGDLKNYIDTQYADNPQMAQAIKSKLGLDYPTNVNPKSPFKTSLGELYNQTKALKSDISAGATRGTKVFTSEDKLTDDAVHTLTGFMKTQGVDFAEANKFWAKYAPIRNQLVSEAKPFLQTGTQTKTFAGTLERVAKGTDINNENFINQVEYLLGQPINAENKAIVAKMAENEKVILSKKIEAAQAITDAEMVADKSLSKLSSQQFETERQARIRSVIKKIIGATVLLGADKTLKKYTGVGF